MIERDVPMPFDGLGKGKSIYPFMEMDVGDSAFFEGQKSSGRANSMAKKYAQRSGRKFTCRAVNGGVRIWRIL